MHHRHKGLALFGALLVATTMTLAYLPSVAQPAKGAAAAFERVKEVMNNRFRDMKLSGDPDQDFANLLVAHHEDLIFLAKTQLEFGGDRELRQLAQKVLNDQEIQIDQTKKWQVRRKEANYRAHPDQPPHGSGPLDRRGAAPEPTKSAPVVSQAPPTTTTKPAASAALPLVSGTVEKVDAAAGRVTIDHGPIPNLNMDGMTMVFRVQDPALLKSLKAGARIRFSADRVQGQITLTRIEGR